MKAVVRLALPIGALMMHTRAGDAMKREAPGPGDFQLMSRRYAMSGMRVHEPALVGSSFRRFQEAFRAEVFAATFHDFVIRPAVAAIAAGQPLDVVRHFSTSATMSSIGQVPGVRCRTILAAS